MKVLHLSSEKSWRGGEQQIAYLIEELTKSGIENYVACKKGSAFEKHCNKNKIPFISLRFSGSFDFITALAIKKYCKWQAIDLVHMHTGNSHSVGLISALLGNNSKLVLSRRVDFPVRNNLLSKYKFNHNKLAKIICVSEAIKAILLPSIKQKDKVTVVHSGIDLSRFEGASNKELLHTEYGLKKDEKIIANISALAPHKDYFTFIDTADYFIKNGGKAKFFIIGNGPLKKDIKKYIAEKNMKDHIILTGFRNDIQNILPEVNVFLITSKTEGLGTSILDAMASHVPVVATKAGGIPEIVKHKTTGMLYQVQDYKGLSHGLQAVLTDSKLRNQLVNNAYDFVAQYFSKEQTAFHTLKIYRSLVND